MPKYKLSTFISREITGEHYATQGFGSVLTFLPELYAACKQPVAWIGETNERGQRLRMRDEFMHPGGRYERYEFAQRAFARSHRAELRLWPFPSDPTRLGVVITFYKKGLDKAAEIEFAYDLIRDEIGAGAMTNLD